MPKFCIKVMFSKIFICALFSYSLAQAAHQHDKHENPGVSQPLTKSKQLDKKIPAVTNLAQVIPAPSSHISHTEHSHNELKNKLDQGMTEEECLQYLTEHFDSLSDQMIIEAFDKVLWKNATQGYERRLWLHWLNWDTNRPSVYIFHVKAMTKGTPMLINYLIGKLPLIYGTVEIPGLPSFPQPPFNKQPIPLLIERLIALTVLTGGEGEHDHKNSNKDTKEHNDKLKALFYSKDPAHFLKNPGTLDFELFHVASKVLDAAPPKVFEDLVGKYATSEKQLLVNLLPLQGFIAMRPGFMGNSKNLIPSIIRERLIKGGHPCTKLGVLHRILALHRAYRDSHGALVKGKHSEEDALVASTYCPYLALLVSIPEMPEMSKCKAHTVKDIVDQGGSDLPLYLMLQALSEQTEHDQALINMTLDLFWQGLLTLHTPLGDHQSLGSDSFVGKIFTHDDQGDLKWLRFLWVLTKQLYHTSDIYQIIQDEREHHGDTDKNSERFNHKQLNHADELLKYLIKARNVGTFPSASREVVDYLTLYLLRMHFRDILVTELTHTYPLPAKDGKALPYLTPGIIEVHKMVEEAKRQASLNHLTYAVDPIEQFELLAKGGVDHIYKLLLPVFTSMNGQPTGYTGKASVPTHSIEFLHDQHKVSKLMAQHKEKVKDHHHHHQDTEDGHHNLASKQASKPKESLDQKPISPVKKIRGHAAPQ